MTDHVFKAAITASILCTGCVAGPGGSNNAANRTITGAAAGAVLGGLAGSALGSNAASGAIVGGAVGAVVNPNHVFRRDTRGYCMLVDSQGQPVLDANGQPIYDESGRCEMPPTQ